MTHVHLPLRHKRFGRLDRRIAGWTKPMLVEAVRNVQQLCPPRPSRRSKADLERIVLRALSFDDDHPIRLAMQVALSEAREHTR